MISCIWYHIVPYDIICLWYHIYDIIWKYIWYHMSWHTISYVYDIILDVYYIMSMISCVWCHDIMGQYVWYHMYHRAERDLLYVVGCDLIYDRGGRSQDAFDKLNAIKKSVSTRISLYACRQYAYRHKNHAEKTSPSRLKDDLLLKKKQRSSPQVGAFQGTMERRRRRPTCQWQPGPSPWPQRPSLRTAWKSPRWTMERRRRPWHLKDAASTCKRTRQSQ
jgi:hypothetical protein